MPYKNPAARAEGHRRWREANREKDKERQRKWRAANPDKKRAQAKRRYAKNRDKERERAARWQAANPGKKREYTSRWRAANPDKKREYSSRWYAANRDKALAVGRLWDAANLDKRRARGSKRRALKRSQICDCCTTKQIADEFYFFIEHGVTEVDHVLPLAMGGLHCRKNLQLLTVLEHKAKTKLDCIRIAEFRRSNKISLLPARVA